MLELNYTYISKSEFDQILNSLKSKQKVNFYDVSDFKIISRNVKILSAFNYIANRKYDNYSEHPDSTSFSTSDDIEVTYLLGELFYYKDSISTFLAINIKKDGTIDVYAKTTNISILKEMIEGIKIYDLGNNYYNYVIPYSFIVYKNNYIDDKEVDKKTFIYIDDVNIDENKYIMDREGHIVYINDYKVIIKKANAIYSHIPIQVDPYLLIATMSVAKISKATRYAREQALKILTTKKIVIYGD